MLLQWPHPKAACSHSPLPFPSLVPLGIQLEVPNPEGRGRCWGRDQRLQGQLHGAGSRPLSKPATHFLYVLSDCSRLEGCGHLMRELPCAHGRQQSANNTLMSAKSVLRAFPHHSSRGGHTHLGKLWKLSQPGASRKKEGRKEEERRQNQAALAASCRALLPNSTPVGHGATGL